MTAPTRPCRRFEMCPACAREYHDPLNRRFHAQPAACPVCGPQVYLWDTTGDVLAEKDGAAARAAVALQEGKILAIKGLGGYHLVCDATNEESVNLLRARKHRKFKPFALMGRDLGALEGYVELPEEAKRVLTGIERPIALLLKGSKPLPEALAPGNADLGVMLPYTPLQHLLFAEGAPELLVMTSANRPGEPIVYCDEELLEKLSGLADLFLAGTRPIARRVDDSVVALFQGDPVILRRARGYAPAPVLRSEWFKRPVLALGGMLKNAIALSMGGYAFVSQHLGDLNELEAFNAFQETIHDLHPHVPGEPGGGCQRQDR